mgnify:CR=1 FL=1
MLANPILPLGRIVRMLFITGPFERIAPILDEFNEPVEMAASAYPDPKALLQPYREDLQLLEQLKGTLHNSSHR